MIRPVLAATIDSLAVAALGYAAFRFGVAVAPCRNQGECSVLTPLVAVCVLIAVGAYFWLGHVLFHSTLGQRVVHE